MATKTKQRNQQLNATQDFLTTARDLLEFSHSRLEERSGAKPLVLDAFERVSEAINFISQELKGNLTWE